MSAEDLVKAIVSDNAVEASDVFLDVINSKLADSLDNERISVGQTVFGKEDE